MLSRTLCLLPPSPQRSQKQRICEVSIFVVVFSLFVCTLVRAKGSWFCVSSPVYAHGCLSHVASPKAPIPSWWEDCKFIKMVVPLPSLADKSSWVLPIVPTPHPCNLKRPGLQLKHTIYTFAGVFFRGQFTYAFLALRGCSPASFSPQMPPQHGAQQLPSVAARSPGVKSE